MKYVVFLIILFLTFLLLDQKPPKNNDHNIEDSKNYLQISSVNIYEPIIKGYSTSLLDIGVLISPMYKESNNIVIYGHRYSNASPLRRYLKDIDEVRIGDDIFISLDNIMYQYEVTDILIINPKETWITSDTKEEILTIVTCTPIYLPINRLVVISKLVRKW